MYEFGFGGTFNGATVPSAGYDGEAGGRNDAGLYNIQYLVEPNPNYAQAIIFTKAEGVNRYRMSIMDVDGNQRYICTGVPYEGNTSQIRTTTDASKALVVEIRATNVNGNFNIYNTEADNYIGSQDAGVYTVKRHIDFNIVKAVEAEVTLNIAAGKYATRIFPFAAEIPEGVTVYSCATIKGQELDLTKEDSIAPNVPYILYSEKGVETTLTGYGTAIKDTYEAGILTGVYGEGTVPVESYVLQTQNDVQGFYKVTEDGETVNYAPYRAYLTDHTANAKAFFFGGDVTSINGVEGAEGATEVVRYNAAGVKVSAPVKGLNIVKMSDGTVKKMMVK